MPFESPLELQKRHNKNFSLDFLSLGGDSRLRKAKDVYKEPQRYVTETPVLSKKRVFTEKEPFYNEFNEFEEDNEPKRAQKRNISGNFDKSNDSPFLEEFYMHFGFFIIYQSYRCYYKPKRFIEEIQNRGLAGNSNHSDFRHNQLAKDRETSSKMESLENKIQKLKVIVREQTVLKKLYFIISIVPKASIKKLENERKEQRKVVKKADILAKFNPMINLKAERIILNVSSDELKVINSVF